MSTVENFAPIGTISNQFKGTFDGGKTYDAQGNCTETYTISNLTINIGGNNVGLFGYVGEGGTIKNVTLNNVDVTGNDYVGGLVGYNYGTIENCTVSGKVTGKDSYPYVGGLVGRNNNGTVSGNTAISNVSGTGNGIGGVVGYNDGTVSGNKFYSKKGDVGSNSGGTVIGNTQLYLLTLPEGVTATATGTGDTVITIDGKTYAVGEVTLKATDNNAVIRSTSYTNNDNGTVSFTPTADTNISSSDLTFYYAVSIPNCVQSVSGTSIDISGTTYYQNGATLTLTAKTGYTLDSTSVTVSANTSISATLADGYYVFGNATDGYTLATTTNTTAYPDLIQVYALTLPEGVTATGDTVITVGNTTYAAGEVTLKATDASKLLQNVTVNGESDDDGVFTVTADTKVTADSVKFGNGGKSVVVVGTTGDLSSFSSVYSITASKENSTLVGNGKNNTVVLTGGGENILTGGGGNDTFKFESGGGIVTDYGIGATKSGDGKTLSAAPGSDVVKVSGNVTGIYFDRNSSSKKSAKFTAVVTYGSGDETQIIVLQNINKKPTKYGSNPVYQTNDVAAATLKIWDMSGTKQAILSAAKLKKLFHDDSDLSELSQTVQTQLVKLNSIGALNLPAVDQLNQTAQATFNGGDNG